MSEVLEQELVDIKTNKINELIQGFITEYSITQTPIEVSFRALLPELKNIDRYTHLIHSYPAKLLLHIPYFFLNNGVFSKPGDVVLDPFCGTGTVLLEAFLANRNSIGADANPLARLIAEVKVRQYQTDSLKQHLHDILIEAKSQTSSYDFPDVVNINFWFNSHTKSQLNSLRIRIESIENYDIKNFFLICFSNLIKKVSYADPRVSVPVRLNENRYKENSPSFLITKKRLKELDSINVYEKFESIVKENILRIDNLNNYRKNLISPPSFNVVSNDARKITQSLNEDLLIPDRSVDLIVTSPPYAGAQKYIRSSSLNLGWLSLAKVSELKALDKLNIGRETFSKSNKIVPVTNILDADILINKIKEKNIVRAQIVANYLIEMQLAIKESIRVLKNGGYFILIVGNNTVCDHEFNTQEYFTDFIKKQGLDLVLKMIDDIKSYGLMTKRNKTADIISREWVLIFRK